jgi:heme exporter protein D
MALGPHAFFILAAYAATALIVGGLIVRAIVNHRVQERALAELERRGVVRRSDRRDSSPLAGGESPAAGAG